MEIVDKLSRLDASGVYELDAWIPEDEEEKISKAFATSVYAKVLSAYDIDRAVDIARKAISMLPDDWDKGDEAVRKTLANSLRILAVEAYRRNKEESKEYLEELEKTLDGSQDPELMSLLERVRAYKARLFGGSYKPRIDMDLRDPVVLSNLLAAAIASDDPELVEEILRKGLLKGTLSSGMTNELKNALDYIYIKQPSWRSRAVLAFFTDDVEADSDVAKFALDRRNQELRSRIKKEFSGTALEALAMLEEAREDPAKAIMLLRRLNELDLSDGFKDVVSAEAHLLNGIYLYESGLYEEALNEALKATKTDLIDLAVSAYRLAIESSLKVNTNVTLKLLDEAYYRFKPYRGNKNVDRLMNIIRSLKPFLLYSQKSKIEAFIESLKSGKSKRK